MNVGSFGLRPSENLGSITEGGKPSINEGDGRKLSITEGRKSSTTIISPTARTSRSSSITSFFSASPEKTRQNFIKELKKPSENFEKFSLDIMKLLNKRNSGISKEISQFQINFKEHIALLKASSWKEMSKKKGDLMATEVIGEGEFAMTMAEFRKVAKGFQEKITGMAGETAGFAEMTWNAAGTDSYKSDIDNFCTPAPGNENAPQLDQIATKVLSEVVWKTIFGGVASTQIDLESYLEHPGSARNTEAQLKTPEGKQQFTRLELTMSALDMKRAFGSDEAGWKAYKNDFLAKLPTHLESSFRQIFKEAENFDKNLDGEIREQMLSEHGIKNDGTNLYTETNRILENDPDAYKKAALTFKTSRTMVLSAQMDEDAQQIDKNLKRMEELNDHISDYNGKAGDFFKEQMEKCRKEYHDLVQKNDVLEVRIATRGAMRNAMFDETYLTQGAYNRICHVEGGQLTSQVIQQNIEKLRRRSTDGAFVIIEKKGGREPSRLEKMISGMENISKLTHKLNEYNHEVIQAGSAQEADEMMQHGAVESSKYTERSFQASVEVFEEIRNKISKQEGSQNSAPSQERIEAEKMVEHAKGLHEVSVELLRLKRQDRLNMTSSLHELGEALKDQIDIKEIEPKLKEILNTFEAGGSKGDKEEVGEKEKFDVLKARLAALLTEKGIVPNEALDKKLDTILMARTGFSRLKNQEINQMHQRSKEITLKKLGLVSKEAIANFHKEAKELMDTTLQLSVAHNIIPDPGLPSDESGSLTHLLINSKPILIEKRSSVSTFLGIK